MNGYILILLFLLSCSSCTDTVPFSEQEQADVTAAARKALNDYYDAVREKGLLAEFDYLDSSAGFFWVPPGYKTHLSYDSVAAAIRRNAAMFRSVNNKLETVHIVPLTRDFASYTARMHSVMTDTAGTEMSVDLLESGVLVRRSGNKWKLLCGQTAIISNQ